jgi:hypothetical protein
MASKHHKYYCNAFNVCLHYRVSFLVSTYVKHSSVQPEIPSEIAPSEDEDAKPAVFNKVLVVAKTWIEDTSWIERSFPKYVCANGLPETDQG